MKHNPPTNTVNSLQILTRGKTLKSLKLAHFRGQYSEQYNTNPRQVPGAV